ncbi:MAG: ATP-binding protein [Bacteroidota bacterium]
MKIIIKIARHLRSFKWLYTLAVFTVIFLVFSSQFLVQHSIKDQEKDAAIINIAGKQRMLSQNIAKTALILNQPQSETFGDSIRKINLEELLKEWETAHLGLQHGEVSLSLPGNNSPEVSRLFQHIEDHFLAIHKAGVELLRTQENRRKHALIQTILFHEPNFLFGMNAIVKQYEIEANQKLARLRFIEAMLGILTIVILLCEVIWIFRPAFLRIRSQRDQLRTMNADLEQAQEEARKAAKAKENFFSVVTHELRTPLNAIVGVSGFMGESSLPKEHQENIEVLQSSSKHLLALVNDILDLSKIEAGGLQLESIPFDLHKEVNELKQVFSLKARQKNIYLRFYIAKDVPKYVKGDPIRLKQILTNLINNGIKFTKEGGITLTINTQEQTEESVALEFTVADTGIGIPEDKQDAIFKAFSQADSSTTRKFGGTGLGLAITRELIAKQGGEIRVESKEGEGARFLFSLAYPIVSPEAFTEKLGITSMKDINPDSLQGLRILIAEDDTMNQFVIRKLMKRWGINFQIANNGREAIEYLMNEEPYDLLLMDFDMPEMNGSEAAIKIRSIQDPYFQQLPIIAITASAMEVVRKTLAETGMDDFIPKPFYSKDLAGIILKYTDAKV